MNTINPCDYLDPQMLETFGIVDYSWTNEIKAHSYEHYSKWVQRGDSSPLKYLEDHRKDARTDLTSVMKQVNGAIVFLFSYHPQKISFESFLTKKKNPNRMGSYVFGFEGEDYHKVLSSKLKKIGEQLKCQIDGLEYQLSLDIHPVLERDLAWRTGLGWFGKNSMLISKKHGSFFIIGSLLLNKKLSTNEVVLEADHCGTCRRCVVACPTDAIDESNRQIIAAKCISTYTIEIFKDDVTAPKGMENGQGEIFGCDICQDVCPWNERLVKAGKVKKIDEKKFEDSNSLILETFFSDENPERKLEALSNNKYAKLFKNTPLGRTGRVGMLKNLRFWKNAKKKN